MNGHIIFIWQIVQSIPMIYIRQVTIIVVRCISWGKLGWFVARFWCYIEMSWFLNRRSTILSFDMKYIFQ